MNGFSEGQLPKRFRSDDYQVLVIAETYQTGSDEPLLHIMYVEKKVEGVKVSRPCLVSTGSPGKTDTFVLDFVNSAEDIQSAFAPFYERA